MRLFTREISRGINKAISQVTNKTEKPSWLTKTAVLRQEVLEIGQRFQPMLSRISLVCGGLVLVGGVSGAKWGISYVQVELVPQLSELLSQAIDRPIQLGAVEQVSWSGIRLGRSVIPATATDADQIVAEAIDIRFNPLDALNPQQLELTMTLIKPTAYIDQSETGEWLNLKLEFHEEEQIQIGQIRLQDATVTLAPRRVTLKKKEADPDDQPWDTSDVPTLMTLRRVNGSLSLQEQGQRLVFEMAGQPHERGTVKLKGNMRLGADQLQLALQTQALQIKSFAPFIPTDLKIEDGLLNADVDLQLQPDRPPVISGSAELRDLSGWAKGEPNLLSRINGRFRFQGQEATLSQGRLHFGLIPFQLDGKIHLERGFDLNAKVLALDARPFMQTLKLKVPFPVEGVLQADDLRITGALDHPMLSGTAQAVKPVKLDRLTIAAVQGNFSLALAEDHLWLHEIRLMPVTGGSITARAEIWLEEDNADIKIAVEDIPADRLAQLYQIKLPGRSLGQFNAQTQVTLVNEEPSISTNWQLSQGDYPAQGKVVLKEDILQLQDTAAQIGNGMLSAQGELKQGRWQASLAAAQVPLNQLIAVPGQLQGQLQVTGSAKSFSLDTIQASGQMDVQIAQGAINAELSAAQGEWQAQVSGARIPLSQIAADWSGELQGNVKLDGNLAQLNIAGTHAEGTAALSDGVAFVDRPLTTDFAWNGTKLHLKQAKTENVSVNGWITPALNENQITEIADLDLDLDIQDYDLARLPMMRSVPMPITGLVSLTGKLTGTPNSPQINSNVQLDRFAVQDFQFEPLQGQLQSQPNRQLNLDLKGRQDQLALVLDSKYRPTAFTIQLDQAKAEGKLVGNRLITKLRNLALEKLSLIAADLGSVRGLLAGDFEIDLAKFAQPVVTGAIEITQPAVGPINAVLHPNHIHDRLTGKILYRNGTVALSDGALQVGKSGYAIAGQINPQAKQWSGQVAVERGNFQDLLTLLSPEDLLALIRQVTGSTAANRVQVDSTSAAVPLPTPTDFAGLAGTFSGTAAVQGSAQGIAAQFGIQGQDWRLADYGIRQIMIANAQFNGQTLMLPAVQAEGFTLSLAGRPQQFDAQFGFAGQLSPKAVAGQLQLGGIALPQLQTALNLPLQMGGKVHAVAAVSGNPAQPNLVGELHLDDVNVREMAVQPAKVGFSYVDRQFHLESWESITEPE